MIKKFNFSDNKPIENEKEDDNTKKISNEIEDSVGCGCCCDDGYTQSLSPSSSSSSSPSSINSTSGKSNIEEEGEHEREEKKRKEKNKNVKILIMMGVVLTIPLVVVELLQFYYILKDGIIIDYFLLFLSTPIQILLGRPFYKRFYNSLRKKRSFTVDTLVVSSTSIAYVYSIIATFTNQDARFFKASASVLTIFTIGEYVESRVLGTIFESIKRLVALQPKTAIIVTSGGNQMTVNIDAFAIGNVFIVKPGYIIATDGVVVHGESSIDESMITGKFLLVDKSIGDKVIGGTTNKNGYLHIQATRVGSQTVLSNIVEIVRKAKSSKPSIQRIADKCAKYFIPCIFAIDPGLLYGFTNSLILIPVLAAVGWIIRDSLAFGNLLLVNKFKFNHHSPDWR
jgi:P-type Cu+ transporter